MSCTDTIRFYAELNYEVTAEDDFSDSFVLQDNDGGVLNITAFTLGFELKDSLGGSTVATATVTKTDAANGQFNVRIPKETLDDLTVGTPYYLYLTADDGTNEITRVKGQFIINH